MSDLVTNPDQDLVNQSAASVMPAYTTNTNHNPVPDNYRAALKIFIRKSGPVCAMVLVISGLIYTTFFYTLSIFDLFPIFLAIAGYGIFEWLVHKFLFHPEHMRLLNWTPHNLMSRMHNNHHQEPENYNIMFFSGPTVLAVAIIATLIVQTIFSDKTSFIFTTTFILMYLRYEWLHFLEHTNIKFSSGYMKRLYQNHILHHTDPTYNGRGVSMMFVDQIIDFLRRKAS
jgi:hypothetical protein